MTPEIEPADGLVKLTVIHDGFEEGSGVFRSISKSWPGILWGLKTLLEVEGRLAVGA